MLLVSFSVTVDAEKKLIRIALRDVVSDETLIALSTAVRQEPALREGYGVLYDCRGATEIWVSGDLIRSMGRRAKSDRNPIAFLAVTPAAFGLARMYQLVSEGEERIRIFSDEGPAIIWLMEARPTE